MPPSRIAVVGSVWQYKGKDKEYWNKPDCNYFHVDLLNFHY